MREPVVDSGLVTIQRLTKDLLVSSLDSAFVRDLSGIQMVVARDLMLMIVVQADLVRICSPTRISVLVHCMPDKKTDGTETGRLGRIPKITANS